MFTNDLQDRRAHLRVRANFGAAILKSGCLRAAKGVTQNISQGGAFIQTEDWQAFSVEDRATVTIMLPAGFSGQDVPIGLEGMAIVSRVDPQHGGVGLRFERHFKFLERVNVS
jgi:hypothetical protein